MAVDFQSHQEEAQRNTTKLVALLIMGLLSIIATVTVLLTAVFYYGSGELQPLAAVAVAAPLTTLGIVGASLVKSSQIKSGGGSYVAASMGGRQVDFNTLDPAERQLRNVVEEIAIASGMPVPAVFVLDQEPAINAFAAGWTADNAAIGVTRGALVELNRSELQGIVAHEFSHIRNGDTRVKTRIIGWVFGIAIITVLGRILLQQLWWGPRRRDNKDNTALLIVAAGVGLVVIGWVGTLFARMVQAAVSRQREFLADASAVQYTRDPSGIGGALLKIAAIGNENKIRTAHATEANHLFFAPAISAGFASHPPLAERISRLLPDWDGTIQSPRRRASKSQESATADRPATRADHPFQGFPGNVALPGYLAASLIEAGPDQAPASQGPPFPSFDGASAAHIDRARTLLAEMPEVTRDYLRTRQGAVAAVVGALITPDPQLRDQQLAETSGLIGMEPDYLAAASHVILDLNRPLQLPAVDLALRSIHETPLEYRRSVATAIRSIAMTQTHHDLFLWVLRRVVLRHLEDQHDEGSARHDIPLDQRRAEAATVYALLADHNSSGKADALASYVSAIESSGGRLDHPELREHPTLDQVDDALVRLASLDTVGRQAFVRGATAAVLHDRQITPDEAELIRVVADAVRLPVPPLLPVSSQ